MSEKQPTQPTGPRAGEPLSLERLLAIYTAWSSADVVETARRRAHDAGDTERAAALEAMAGEAPSPTEALAAQFELTSLLAGWRWHTVRAAREAGASWDDVAAVTGTDPATARAEYLDRVRSAGEQAVAAGFEFRDEQRYRDAARPDPASRHDSDTHPEAEFPEPESSAMSHDDQPHDENEPAQVLGGWPVPDPTRPLGLISDRELITRAELDEAVAMTGIGGDRHAAWVDLDATRVEAERRAVDQSPDSLDAQVAGYISLVGDDHSGAMHAEAASWRHDLDQVLPPADTSGVAADPAARSVAQNAVSADARMSAEPPDGAGFDLEHLDEVTEQFGYAVFDPDAPGGVRAPTSREYADLLAELTPTPRAAHGPERADADADADADLDVTDSAAGRVAPGWSDTAEAQVDEVARRTADPTFAYDPTADWADPTYREPRTQAEADARTAYLDAERAATPPAVRPELRELTELEDALYDAAEEATLADRAHDPDPQAWARYDDLLAVQDLRTTSRPSASEARHTGPEVEFEDQLFRRSLDDAVPDDAPSRGQAIERAVDVGRDRFWSHGLTTYPEQALALSRDTDPTDRTEHRAERDAGDYRSREAGARTEQAWVDGPWTDGDERRWSSSGDLAGTTAGENAALDRPSVPDDPTWPRDLLEQARARIAARDTAATAATQDEEVERREQLTRWHDDDSWNDRHHTIGDSDDLSRDVGLGVDNDANTDDGGTDR